ncbi:MAG: Holliday junction branch migration protein RuvA [bacterium]|nr:Holliday junction branch migration protein RuvA [bacterium]
MIAELNGICQRRRAGQVVISVGGIGYAVAVPEPLADSIEVGQECTLYTHLLVRENAISLVGFASANERDLFNTLIGISGVGSKLALSIITKMSPGAFVSAVLAKDEKALVKIPGLGKKGAKRLLLEMETKITKIAQDLPPEPLTTGSAVNPEAKAVLMSLGCTEEEAEKALSAVLADLPADAAVNDIVIAAMSAL